MRPATALAIRQDHGGTLLVDSTVGRGTSVRLLIPKAAETIGAAEERARLLDSSATQDE